MSHLRKRGVVGAPMISSFSIRNFRAFDDIKIEKCRAVNVIMGDNGSGKTALLEGIFLAAGVSPELILRTFEWRGFPRGQMSGTVDDIHEALWSDLFFNFNTRKHAVISMRGPGEQNRSVEVRVNDPDKMEIIPPPRGSRAKPTVVPSTTPIEFKWTIQGYPDVTIRPTFDANGLVLAGATGRNVKSSFFASNQAPSASEVTKRFSALNRNFASDEFVDNFKRLFPNIEGLSIEMSAGSPMLFAAVSGVSQRIPLSLASGGLSRVAAILLSISEQKDGIVIIDEIENGLYYKRLPEVWTAILAAADHYNCQLFVSTHSQECLEALAPLVAASSDKFAFLRVVRREGSGAAVRQFAGSQIAQAIMDNVEVR